MTMSEWAKHEVELACKRENPDYQHGGSYSSIGGRTK